MPLVDERVGGHDLDRGDAELCEMFDRRWMREARERPARGFGDRRVKPREAAQVELVDDQRLWRDALVSRLTCGRRSRDRLRRVRGRCPRRTRTSKDGGWNGRSKPPGVRIGQQFGRVEAEPPLRIIRTLDAEAVTRAGAEARRDAAQDAVGVTRHRRANNLAIAVVDAQRRALGVRQHERRFEAARRDEDAAGGFRVAHSAGLMISR